MTTTLANLRIELSKQLGDYWSSTLTEAGTNKTIVDTILTEKTNDWISDAPQEQYALIVDGTYAGVERKATSLDTSTGILTLNSSVGGTIASGVTYEVHRLFSAAEKKRALIYAARRGFPYIFNGVRDSSLTVGNWLRDPDFEWAWTTTALNTYWVASVTTQYKYTTAPYYWRGDTSLRMTGAVGSVYQSNTQNPDLTELIGETVTFTMKKAWCNTASSLRLSIYDGTTTTYSSYHAGNSSVAELSVSATIASTATQVKFAIHHDVISTTSYIDDARVTGPGRSKLYFGDVGLAWNMPHMLEQSADADIEDEPWQLLRNWEIGPDGYLYLYEGTDGYRLRVTGMGYLDFLASGVSSTDWAATINIDAPQTDILIAEAIMYLYTQLVSPNYTSGERDNYIKILQYWEAELDERRAKFGMRPTAATVKWGLFGGGVSKSSYGKVNY